MPRGKKVFLPTRLKVNENLVETDKASCTAHALANILGCSFSTAQTITFASGRKQNQGFFPSLILEYINSFYPERKVFITDPSIPKYTAKVIAASFPGKRLYCIIRGHAFAIVNGTIIDSAMGARYVEDKKVIKVWILKDTSVTGEDILAKINDMFERF